MRYLTTTTTTITAAAMLIGAGALLAACSSQETGTITAPESEAAEYTIDEAKGETSMKITTPAGEAIMRSGQNVPLKLPDGFSLYPGSNVVSNTIVNQPAGAGTMVVFAAPASAADIIAHFKGLAQQAGYTIEIEATMNDTIMLSGKRTRDAARFMVSTGAISDGKTSGQLVTGTGKAS